MFTHPLAANLRHATVMHRYRHAPSDQASMPMEHCAELYINYIMLLDPQRRSSYGDAVSHKVGMRRVQGRIPVIKA